MVILTYFEGEKIAQGDNTNGICKAAPDYESQLAFSQFCLADSPGHHHDGVVAVP